MEGKDNLDGLNADLLKENAELRAIIERQKQTILFYEGERAKQEAEIKRLKNAVLDKVSRNEELIATIRQAEQQSVKDTAKEILQALIEKAYSSGCIDLNVNEVKAWFREDYGVEVD